MAARLAELTPDNVAAACRIEVKPEQGKFVGPVVESIAQAYVHYGTAWPRLILDDDRVVGFVMGNFDPENEIEAFRGGIWRLNIAAEEQGRGYRRITVLWVQGDGGPEGFYLRLGFIPTGQVMGGEIVGELLL